MAMLLLTMRTAAEKPGADVEEQRQSLRWKNLPSLSASLRPLRKSPQGAFVGDAVDLGRAMTTCMLLHLAMKRLPNRKKKKSLVAFSR